MKKEYYKKSTPKSGALTFAQTSILDRIEEKRGWSKVIKNVDGYIVEPEYIEHVDYSEGSLCPQE